MKPNSRPLVNPSSDPQSRPTVPVTVQGSIPPENSRSAEGAGGREAKDDQGKGFISVFIGTEEGLWKGAHFELGSGFPGRLSRSIQGMHEMVGLHVPRLPVYSSEYTHIAVCTQAGTHHDKQ